MDFYAFLTALGRHYLPRRQSLKIILHKYTMPNLSWLLMTKLYKIDAINLPQTFGNHNIRGYVLFAI